MKDSSSRNRELVAWKNYVKRCVKVYVKAKMLRVGQSSWWSRIRGNIPAGFANNQGRVCEPWLSKLALWLQNYSVRVSEALGGIVDNIVPTAVFALLSEDASSKTTTGVCNGERIGYGSKGCRQKS